MSIKVLILGVINIPKLTPNINPRIAIDEPKEIKMIDISIFVMPIDFNIEISLSLLLIVVTKVDKILKDAQAVFMASNKLGILPDEIVESLMPVVLDTKYSPKQVQKAIRDIVKRNTQNYKALEKRIDLLEFIEDYENFPNSPLSAEQYGEIDPADVADAKKEFKKLGRVTDRKSYIQRELDRRARIKHKEKLSGFIQGDLFDE